MYMNGWTASFFGLKLNFMCELNCCCRWCVCVYFFSYVAHSCSGIKLCNEMNIAQIEGEMKNILQNFGGEKKNTENCSEKKENMISNAFFIALLSVGCLNQHILIIINPSRYSRAKKSQILSFKSHKVNPAP